MPGSQPPQQFMPENAATKLSGASTSGVYGSVSGSDPRSAKAWVHWLETADAADPTKWLIRCGECDKEFQARKIKPPLVLAWLVFQSMGAIFQYSMLTEIGQHLDAYEATLAKQCGPEHESHGICLGEAWEMVYVDTLDFPAAPDSSETEGDYDFIVPADKTFSFSAKSRPPTFLVGVEPLAPHVEARWRIIFSDSVSVFPSDTSIEGVGRDFAVVEKAASFGQATEAHLTGAMVLKSRYETPVQFHVFVVDSKIMHLWQVRAQDQCRFEASWKNFSQRHNGQHHGVLVWAWRLTAAFLLISLVVLLLLARRFLLFVEGGKLMSRLIVAKFLLQDFPQQLCIVAYIYAWYARDGLRCQMCLFHPEHCDDEYPLHQGNLLLCLFTLMNACTNQFVLQMKPSKKYSVDDEIFAWTFRGLVICLSTLPFTTAILLLGFSVLHLKSTLLYIVVGPPCILGWKFLFVLPTAVICDD